MSKWENDLSIPDLPVLISLADYFHVSLDELIRNKKEDVTWVPEEKRKDIQKMYLKVNIFSKEGDRIRVNLPLALVKMAKEMGLMNISQITDHPVLQKLDLDMIMSLIESGVIGQIVEIDDADGDHVEVSVE